MIIKVCGLREPDNIKQVSEIRDVNLIGMIFYAPSQRYVDSAETAASLTTVKDKGIVGVFVDEAPDVVVLKCAQYRLDYIQLHGFETPEYLILLQNLVPSNVKFIKAFSIQSKKGSFSDFRVRGALRIFSF